MGEWQQREGKSDGVDNVAVDVVDDSTDGSDEDDDLTTDGNATAIAALRNVETSNFGNIAVNNSRDVHFGNNAFYQGPVTFKQFVYASDKDSNDIPLKEELKDVVTQIQSQKMNGFQPTTEKRLVTADAGMRSPTRGWRRRHVIWIATAGVGVVVLLILLILFTGTNYSGFSVETTTVYSPQNPGLPEAKSTGSTSTSTRRFTLVPRNTWLAQPTTKPIDALHHPVPYVIISHSNSGPCSGPGECNRRVRDIQAMHVESNNWSDIAYNFLVGGDGSAYMGRGWDEVGAHSGPYNPCSVGICFIGTFKDVLPPPRQIDVALQVIDEGVQLGKIRADYRLLMHHDVSPWFNSPGEYLIAYLTKLPHYSNQTVVSCSQLNEKLL